jgi:CubicO group peptidase (beta-lactamase class C family)
MTRRLSFRVLAPLAAVILIILLAESLASTSLFWHRYLLGLGSAPALPQLVLEPRIRVAGGNEPPAPRVQPALENLDEHALELAAGYAGAHGSLALIVSRHSHIVFERYWQGTGFDTLEDAQSFTPLLAALATGAAISRRELGWPDEPIGMVLTEWRADPRGQVTLRNLLQMSSGLQPPAAAWLPWSQGAAELYGTDITAVHAGQALVAAPGQRWQPQRADPQLLAQVLSRAAGMPYAQYLSDVLWRRLGAGDAWLWLDRPGGAPHADCCLQARQGDWIRVAELLVKDGDYRGAEVIRPGWIAQMATPARGNPDFGAYLHLGRHGGTEPYAASVWVVEGQGDQGGNHLWIVPSLGIAIVHIAARAGAGWDDSRIPNLIIRGAKDFVAPRPHLDTDLSKLVPAH